MTPAALDLLLSLQTAGFTLTADGPRLLVAPGGKLSPEQTAAIKAHKAALLALVRPIDEDDLISGWDDPRLYDAAAYQADLVRLQILHDQQEAAVAVRREKAAAAPRPLAQPAAPGLFGGGQTP